MSADEEWDMLARRLVPGDGQSVAEKLQSYRDGTNPDLQRWRAIGGSPYSPPAPKGGPLIGPSVLRNRRIVAAHKAGVSPELLRERFGLTQSAISSILANAKAWGAR